MTSHQKYNTETYVLPPALTLCSPRSDAGCCSLQIGCLSEAPRSTSLVAAMVASRDRRHSSRDIQASEPAMSTERFIRIAYVGCQHQHQNTMTTEERGSTTHAEGEHDACVSSWMRWRWNAAQSGHDRGQLQRSVPTHPTSTRLRLSKPFRPARLYSDYYKEGLTGETCNAMQINGERALGCRSKEHRVRMERISFLLPPTYSTAANGFGDPFAAKKKQESKSFLNRSGPF